MHVTKNIKILINNLNNESDLSLNIYIPTHTDSLRKTIFNIE